jgi:SAM-dependent methyltransferase
VSEPATTHRFYRDLALWWPLISPAEDYADEAAFAATLLSSASRPVREVLELGSGGGHVASHLKASYTMTLADLSEQMLAVSRVLNPECEHRQGDMRSVRLGRTFDAVLVHDAICYMVSRDDLRAAMATAFAHCRPGGVAVFVPDDVAETFEPATDHGGSDDQLGGRGVRFLKWTWDPNPLDDWTLTEYAFVLRDADGTVDVVHETHRTGLFSADVWLRLLREVGFEASAVTEETDDDRRPREIFVGRRAVDS